MKQQRRQPNDDKRNRQQTTTELECVRVYPCGVFVGTI